MNLIKKGDRERHANGACTVYEYPHGDKGINAAYAEIRGRYPGSGRVVNEESKELVFVVRGSGEMSVEGRSVELKEGDSALIMPGERYSFKGDFDLLICNNPAWQPEQHKNVE